MRSAFGRKMRLPWEVRDVCTDTYRHPFERAWWRLVVVTPFYMFLLAHHMWTVPAPGFYISQGRFAPIRKWTLKANPYWNQR